MTFKTFTRASLALAVVALVSTVGFGTAYGYGSEGRSGQSAPVPTVRTTTTTTGGGQVLGAATFNFTVDLSYGSTGEDVTNLQQVLIDAGLLKIAAPTGWFGPMTRAAVMQWQTAHGVPATGYFGPLSRAAYQSSLNAIQAETGTPSTSN